MLNDAHYSARIARKTTQCNRLVVGVKAERLDQALTPISEIICVLVGCRKVRAGVPCASDSAIPLERCSGYRRARSSHIGCLRLARAAVSRRPCDRAGVIPIQHRPGVEKLRDGTGYPLRSVARIGEWRLPGLTQRIFVKQLPERKILAAPGAGIQRVWSVLIGDVDIIVSSPLTRVDTQSFISRPAKILSWAGDHVQCFPSVPTNMPNVQDPGVAVGRKMAARIGPQAHAIRIAQS